MRRCSENEYEPLIERMLADEIEDAERDRLLRHAESCATCREYVELHHNLLDPDTGLELPSDRELAAMRRAVMGRIRGRRAPFPGFAALFGAWFRQPALAASTAVVALLMLGAGMALGLRWGGGTVLVPRQELDWLAAEARSNRDLADVENSRYLYSNVAFRDLGDGRVGLSFDVTRHMELARQHDDPLVREVLVHSLLQPSPVGTRLEAITVAERSIDPKVKQALIVTMLDDPSQAVRLRALEILSELRDDTEVQSALLAVLRVEDSVQMRMLAMDHLAASNVPAERLGAAIRELRPRQDSALLVRAASHGLAPGESR